MDIIIKDAYINKNGRFDIMSLAADYEERRLEHVLKSFFGEECPGVHVMIACYDCCESPWNIQLNKEILDNDGLKNLLNYNGTRVLQLINLATSIEKPRVGCCYATFFAGNEENIIKKIKDYAESATCEAFNVAVAQNLKMYLEPELDRLCGLVIGNNDNKSEVRLFINYLNDFPKGFLSTEYVPVAKQIEYIIVVERPEKVIDDLFGNMAEAYLDAKKAAESGKIGEFIDILKDSLKRFYEMYSAYNDYIHWPKEVKEEYDPITKQVEKSIDYWQTDAILQARFRGRGKGNYSIAKKQVPEYSHKQIEEYIPEFLETEFQESIDERERTDE